MSHDLLEPGTIGQYLAQTPRLRGSVDPEAIVSAEEIGDGNLNLVFVVRDAHGGSVVLKQALPYVRMVGPEWPLSADRARHEAEALAAHGRAAPGLVPRILGFDEDRFVIAMEDLSDHRVWRAALNDGCRHEGAASSVGEYLAAVAVGTSVLGLDAETVRVAAASLMNLELRAITEELVFSEPLFDIGRNATLPGNRPDVDDLAADDVLVAAMGRAKWTFMTTQEALIHGDLHTGSVMVRAAGGPDGPVDSVRAFDSEFAFYGPVSFDLGTVWAHYVIAASRAVALGDDVRAVWLLGLCEETWTAFEDGFRARWEARRDARVFTDRFGSDLVERWQQEAGLFCAAEMMRRTVGMAKVADVETLPEELRVGAARGLLRSAQALVREGDGRLTPARLVALAQDTLLAARPGEARARGRT